VTTPGAIAVFAAPPRYVQGQGALDTLPAEVARLGMTRPMVVCDPFVLEALRDRL
jgi:glycerol dehydrogenase-like iron-containing ADH family enzyme